VIHNTYVNKQVIRNTGSRASFNGPGGTTAKPTAPEQMAAKSEHISVTAAQQSRVEAAKNNPDLHVANNQGKPKAEAIKAFERNSGEASQAGTGKAERAGGAQEPGNSAFGHKQGDVTTRTTGSQNSAYGKTQSTEAHTAAAHHTTRHTLVASHRPQHAMVWQGGTNSYAKGQPAKPNKKKKSQNEGPGGGH
jgi:hypothetical protein